MGSCLCKARLRKHSILPSAEMLSYKRLITANILESRNSLKVRIKATEPALSFGKEVNYKGRMFLASGCVLPGLDPRRNSKKICQDTCFMVDTPDSILLGLFDGHGDFGADVVNYCSEFIQSYFLNKKDTMLKKPKEFLKTMAIECNKGLRKSKIDIMMSGTTLLLVLFYDSILYHANVGDSRIILATESYLSYDTQLPNSPANQEEIRIHRKIKAKRSIPKFKGINAIQLTKDQKPEDPEERERIIKSGGRIERVCDQSGNKFGPYRVWRPLSHTPGLAMSRSIGDFIAKDIGVCADPVVNSHQFDPNKDHFVILASDGIWDVIQNIDAVSFVMAYKEKCRQNQDLSQESDQIKPDNTTIARLICEEARLRWVSVVESDDVIIDDISCVILDFNPRKQMTGQQVDECNNHYESEVQVLQVEDT